MESWEFMRGGMFHVTTLPPSSTTSCATSFASPFLAWCAGLTTIFLPLFFSRIRADIASDAASPVLGPL